MAGTGSVWMKGMIYSACPPADAACYAYSMVNRQDIPYSLGSPEIRRLRFPRN